MIVPLNMEKENNNRTLTSFRAGESLRKKTVNYQAQLQTAGMEGLNTDLQLRRQLR